MKELETIINRAIPLPTCPEKKVHAIATRVWLKREIEKLIAVETENGLTLHISAKPLPSVTK